MLELRQLTDNDVTLVEKWLQNAHVKKWYDIPHLGVSIDDWMHEIHERDTTYNWITYFIVNYQNKPIGFCQYYACIDSKDEDFGSLDTNHAYGIDYFIGEEDFLGKGFGKQMIKVLTKYIFTHTNAEEITADIDTNNTASMHVLMACGFDLLDDGGSRYVKQK